MIYFKKIITKNLFVLFCCVTLFISLTAFKLLKNNDTIQHIQTREVPLTGNTNQLKGFFKALKNSKNQVVRIAHYGDSSLLGDVISEHLRDKLQQKYGGQGAGFISICASDITMKESGIQEYSDDWQYTSLFLRNPENLAFGISGYVSKPSDGSWVRFQTRDFIHSLKTFQKGFLFYSNAGKNTKIECEVDKRINSTFDLKQGKSVQSLELFDRQSTSVELTFKEVDNTNVYGVSFENGNGVYLDNFPITGNTGVNLLDISDKMLKDFKKYLKYNLIILHYGMNLPTPNGGTLKIYTNKMLSVIAKYKKIFPDAGIIMVGISDRIIKKGNRVITSRETLPIIHAQENIAKTANVAFWNLFEAMGGQDSMDKWVNSAPPLALKDYRHFTHNGGDIVADLFLKAILGAAEK